MNHIYKVIWNKAKHCYTVVSEIAKNHSTSSVTKKKVSIAVILAAGMLSGFSPMVSGAADTTNSEAVVYDQNQTSLKSTNSSVGKNAIALGQGASAVDDSIAIGNGASVVGGSNGKGGVALGKNAHAGYKGTSLGNSAISGREGTIVIGDTTNVQSLYSTVVGTNSTITSDGTAYTLDLGFLGKKSVIVQGAVSTSFGADNTITNTKKVFSGVANSIIGSVNTVTNSNGVTIQGTGNTVSNAYKDMNIGLGDLLNLKNGDYSSIAKQDNGAIAIIGGGNTISDQLSSTVIGFGNTLKGENSTGVFTAGSHNKLTNVSNSLVMGDNNILVNRKNVISLGNNNTVGADDAVAIGNGTTVRAESGVAIGVGSVADRVAGSKGAFAPNIIPDVAVPTWRSTAGAVSVGSSSMTRQIINVAAGTNDTDAVNVAQLKKALESIDVDAGTGIKVDKIIKDGKTTYKISTNIVGSETTTDKTTVTTNQTNTGNTDTSQGTTNGTSTKTGNTVTVSTETKATSFGADNNQKADVKPGGTLNINGDGNNILTSISTSTSDNSSSIKVELKKDLNLSSVTTGDTKMDTNGVTVKDVSLTKDGLSIGNKTYVSNEGLNANDQKVTKVAAGDISEKSTDAVNGSQLFATNQQVVQNAQSISKLGNRINKVGAGAAALAALHPLDFDPDDKWDFAAGYGNYNGENAVAIGAYYRPNEDTMFSVGGSFGNGENMVNAGVSLKLGQGNHVSTSKVAMAKEIKDLRKELEGLKSALLDVNAGKKLDTSKLQLFPDVPKNHWAYEYVSTLKGNGMLTGYPDGEFKGDRPMTRYEFATMLYKAMLEGATLSDKILKEFAPELERFTVDTVHQDKDGKPTVERVRMVKAAK
ncbi:ESPR-type extended signal peptide-containing protein [Allisonella histaminiformans]|uniref:ESPR-type extended signal peptide-containing protein n=1 Tax=Allisonella histaminiformans TaxID=209880 RepID=UPI0026EE8B3E|nr:ESPR-type extended signal peptide-containing protein [Allisonella histaminiformans]